VLYLLCKGTIFSGWRGGPTDMWKRLRDGLRRLWRPSQGGLDERRTAKARARFWAEVREGQREAEERLRPSTADHSA